MLSLYMQNMLKGNTTTLKHLLLSHGWQCKERIATQPVADDFASSAPEWIPAHVPGTIHLDLLAAGRIPDPFIGLNETQVQWVGENDWLYRCAFDLPPEFEHASKVTLCCDGLDTFATAWLNGTQVFTGDNMFLPYRVDARLLLRPGRNELHLLFESAWRLGRARLEKLGERACWNGDASRLYVRKAQYHYGWDWGPKLLTAGPWRAIRLEAYEARIAALHCPVEVAADLRSATLPVRVTLENGGTTPDQMLHLALYAPTGELLQEAALPVTSDEVAHTFSITALQLWWPRGYGAQPLYRLDATLRSGAEELDRQEQRLGLRRLRLVQEPFVEETGTSFFFEVNNTPIFCGGANWIPADSFTSRLTPERYRAWLELAADANMVMLRIWGGGIYEEEAFYTLCDELGLLVWQDFMFACGLYPAANWFLESVRLEAEANVRRLRHHPCIVLWCGNNEDYSLAQSLHLYDATFDGDFTALPFAARTIYERLLPEVCRTLDPTRPYWPGSPYGSADSGSLTTGDTHIWNVWHGVAAPYQDYYKFAGRFVSEFGMQSFPALETIATFAPPAERYPQSRTLDFHNKDAGGPRRLAPYIVDNVRMVADLEGHIYVTQFIQSEALGYALRDWRRRWKGAGREHTAGALVWQLNDCWPVTSWAIVDSLLCPKPAYYTLKRELAPFAVGIQRLSPEQAAVWAVNGLTSTLSAELELRTWTLDGTLVSEERRPAELAPNQAVELGLVECHYDKALVLGARLLKGATVLARGTLWPEPFKYLTLPDPAITVEHVDSEALRISVQRPAKGVWLTGGDTVRWSDNMLDVLPNDPQTVIARGLGAAEVHTRHLQ